MTPPLSDAELVQRLLLAALLGGLLGFERELRQKSAGLRTNTLIAIGSALFTLMSYELADAAGADPSRVAAQIVTGIGFLGAGAIMRTDGGVYGLTTAATIWVNAAVGVAAGGGEYHLAFIATGVTLGVLLLLHPLEGMIDRRFGAGAANRQVPPSAEPSAADAVPRPAVPDGPPSPRRQ
jgi:putative Mg2+ transporter-C (MgtC) family protein